MLGGEYYAIIVMDPWTWAYTDHYGQVAIRPLLKGRENATFILDFFGFKPLKQGKAELKVPNKNILTAFPVCQRLPPALVQVDQLKVSKVCETGAGGQTFLGFFFSPSTIKEVDDLAANHDLNRHQHSGQLPSPTYSGVIWGKKEDYLLTPAGRSIIRHVSALCPLVATLPEWRHTFDQQEKVKYVGHLNTSAFRALLANSNFFLGLGDPLSGPSALEAMLVGTTFINPSFPHEVQSFKYGNPNYPEELRDYYTSQHPYMQNQIGNPYVCTYRMLSPTEPDAKELTDCVLQAFASNLRPRVPDDFTHASYVRRVHAIFRDFL
jgi:hypothetical protein